VGILLNTGELLQGVMVLLSKAFTTMLWDPGELSVVMALFRQHSDQLKTQSAPQPAGRFRIPEKVYCSVPKDPLPPPQLVCPEGQIGVISMGEPTCDRLMVEETPQVADE
jgi:hypothetical protein